MKQSETDAALEKLVNGFRAHVVDITYNFEKDWSGDPAIFFHVVLRDRAAKGVMLGRVTNEVTLRLSEMLRDFNLELFGYTDFRSESELAELQKRRA